MVWLALALVTFQASEFIDAARGGDVERVRSLLAEGAEIDTREDGGQTALIAAAGHGHGSVVRLLLEDGADVSLRTEDGVSALTAAKAAGAAAIVDMLRDAGARESLEEQLDESIRAGDLEAVERLITDGVDVDALDTGDYQTPLMTAVELRQLDILLRLVEAGADPTREGAGIETTGENAISFAARQGSPWALRVLVEARARREDLERALFLGCAHTAVLRIALEAGGNVNARDDQERTPLICAASEGSADAVSTLLEAGADPDAVSADRRTARDWAELRGHEDVVALLEEARD